MLDNLLQNILNKNEVFIGHPGLVYMVYRTIIVFVIGFFCYFFFRKMDRKNE